MAVKARNVSAAVQKRVAESCQLELSERAAHVEARRQAREVDKIDEAAARAARRAKETEVLERRMQLYAIADGRLATFHQLRRANPGWSFAEVEAETERIYERTVRDED